MDAKLKSEMKIKVQSMWESHEGSEESFSQEAAELQVLVDIVEAGTDRHGELKFADTPEEIAELADWKKFRAAAQRELNARKKANPSIKPLYAE